MGGVQLQLRAARMKPKAIAVFLMLYIAASGVCDDIHEAARDGKLDAVKSLLAENRDLVSALDDDSCTPLHLAARNGHSDIVEHLPLNGANVDAQAYNRFTPLHLASDPIVVEILLRYEPDLTLQDSATVQTPLENAAYDAATRWKDKKKWRQIAKLLLDAGAYYDIQSAIYLRDFGRVEALLNANPELANGPHGAQQVALRVAAREGRVDICKLLLHHGSDPDDFKHGLGIPIVCDAVRHPQVVKLLIDAGADLTKRVTWRGDRVGIWIIGDEATPLHYAASDGEVESARLLIKHGVKVDAQDDRGQTALHIASWSDRTAMVRFLLEQGADPSARSKAGTFSSRPAMFRFLLQPGRRPLDMAHREETKRILRNAAKLDASGGMLLRVFGIIVLIAGLCAAALVLRQKLNKRLRSEQAPQPDD